MTDLPRIAEQVEAAVKARQPTVTITSDTRTMALLVARNVSGTPVERELATNLVERLTELFNTAMLLVDKLEQVHDTLLAYGPRETIAGALDGSGPSQTAEPPKAHQRPPNGRGGALPVSEGLRASIEGMLERQASEAHDKWVMETRARQEGDSS